MSCGGCGGPIPSPLWSWFLSSRKKESTLCKAKPARIRAGIQTNTPRRSFAAPSEDNHASRFCTRPLRFAPASCARGAFRAAGWGVSFHPTRRRRFAGKSARPQMAGLPGFPNMWIGRVPCSSITQLVRHLASRSEEGHKRNTERVLLVVESGRRAPLEKWLVRPVTPVFCAREQTFRQLVFARNRHFLQRLRQACAVALAILEPFPTPRERPFIGCLKPECGRHALPDR